MQSSLRTRKSQAPPRKAQRSGTKLGSGRRRPSGCAAYKGKGKGGGPSQVKARRHNQRW